jgi:hypothetical protein
VGIGGCLRRQADFAIGDRRVPIDPVSVKDEGVQLTALLKIRFQVSGFE